MGYTKIFETIVTSTIWQEPNDCKVLWITMLALKDKHDICAATTPALAKLCDLTIEETEKYLEKFQQPDPYSRSQEYEGRRIKRVDGGWFILNGEKYKQLLRSEERKDYQREYQRDYRKRKQTSTSVNNRKQSKPEKPISDSDTDTDTDIINIKPFSKAKFTYSKEFQETWPSLPTRNGNRGSKKKAYKEWQKLTPEEKTNALQALQKQKAHYQKCKESDLFVPEFPDAWRWLRDRRWEDDIQTPKTWQEKFMEENQ